jgi:hypothetical protein
VGRARREAVHYVLQSRAQQESAGTVMIPEAGGWVGKQAK